MTPSAESIVQRQFESYNAHDLDGFMETFAPEMWLLPEQAPLLAGKDEVRRYYREHRFNHAGLQAILLNRMIMGDTVIDHEQLIGLEIDHVIEAIAIYRIVDGLIQHVCFIRA